VLSLPWRTISHDDRTIGLPRRAPLTREDRLRRHHLVLFSFASLAALTAWGCGDDETVSDDDATTTTTTSTGGSGATGGDGGSGGSEGGGGSVPDPCESDTVQLLISEVAVQPETHEFIEVWNPSSTAVDLSNYYLSDNSAYHTLTAGPWTPQQTPNTDFLVQFPAGTIIGANEVLVVELGTDFETAFAGCPDFTVRSGVTCNGSAVPQMVVPANGSLGAPGSLLSNEGEMAILFCWGGSSRVFDVDYVSWDADADPNTHVDKSGVAGYANDTPMATQADALAPFSQNSIGRCDATEPGETLTGGNGLLGHDETSEDFAASFQVFTAPSPGAVNTCN
jgi:hypothetical protein